VDIKPKLDELNKREYVLIGHLKGRTSVPQRAQKFAPSTGSSDSDDDPVLVQRSAAVPIWKVPSEAQFLNSRRLKEELQRAQMAEKTIL